MANVNKVHTLAQQQLNKKNEKQLVVLLVAVVVTQLSQLQRSHQKIINKRRPQGSGKGGHCFI